MRKSIFGEAQIVEILKDAVWRTSSRRCLGHTVFRIERPDRCLCVRAGSYVQFNRVFVAGNRCLRTGQPGSGVVSRSPSMDARAALFQDSAVPVATPLTGCCSENRAADLLRATGARA